MTEKTLLSWELPQAAYFAHWLHAFWPQALLAYLTASTIATIVFTSLFGSATIADVLLVYGTLLVLLIFELIGVSLYYHYTSGTVQAALTTHGVHVIHKHKRNRMARFAAWHHVHSVTLGKRHHTVLLVRKKRFLSGHLLLVAPAGQYAKLAQIFKHYCKQVRE